MNKVLSLREWEELHNEHDWVNDDDQGPHYEAREFSVEDGDNYEYVITCCIWMYNDGARDVEISKEELILYDDFGYVTKSYNVVFGESYRDRAIEMAKEYEPGGY